MDGKVFLAAGVALAVSLGGCASGKQAGTVSAGCQDIIFPIYFQEGSDALTAPALQAIGISAQRAKSCRVLSTEVTGLSDGAGATADSLALSSKRAATVAAVLTSNGLPSPTVSLGASSATALTTRNRPATAVRQPTEVVIRVAQR